MRQVKSMTEFTSREMFIPVSEPSGSDYVMLSEKKRKDLRMLDVSYAWIRRNVKFTEME